MCVCVRVNGNKKIIVGATFAIILGNVVVVFASFTESKTEFTPKELLSNWIRIPFLSYLCVVLVVALILHVVFIRHFKPRLKDKKAQNGDTAEDNNDGDVDTNIEYGGAFVYATISAMVGTQSTLLTKCVSILIRESFCCENQVEKKNKQTVWFLP